MPQRSARVKGNRVRGSVWAIAAAAALLAAGGCSGSGGSRGWGGSPNPDDPRLAQLRAETRAMIGAARDRVFPSLVNIDVVTMTYQGGKESKSLSGGSGTVISKDGYILTNAHVTDDGWKFWCVLADKQRVPAKLIGEDPWTDLAVLKIDPTTLKNGAADLTAAEFGDSSRLMTGDYVLAMGSPFALSRTVTLGIVANTERVFANVFGGDQQEMGLNAEQRTGTFTNWIQHDALINPGNSGGPLVSLKGEIIGVNTRGGMGNSFATPSNLAREVADAIIAHGEVHRSWIGTTFRHTRDTGIETGALVDSIDADGPAARAGLKAGDVLKSINGEAVNARFVEEIPPLLRKIAEQPVGSSLTLGVERNGTPMDITCKTERLERDKGEEAALRTWGLTVQRITDQAAKWRRLPSTRGALVSSMRNDGPAAQAEPRIGWGDVIVAVDGEPTPDIQTLVGIYDRIDEMEDKPTYVMIEFERQGKNFLTLIKPKPEDRPDPPQELPKAWIGVATQPVIKNLADKLAEESGSGADERGFRVVRVYSRTNAERAGLKVGDIITSLNGTRLAPKGLQDAGVLTRAIKQLDMDSTAEMKVLRNGKELSLSVDMERTRQQPEEAPRVRNSDFELVVRDITFFDREDMRWDDTVQGVFVDDVERAGWAGLGGVAPGDVIQQVGDHKVTDLAEYKAAMKAISEAEPKRVVFVVFRGSRTYFRFVQPEWKAVVNDKKGTTEPGDDK